MAEPLPCPSCGRTPTVELDFGWSVACDNCYDADYDYGLERYVSLAPCGSGMTRAEAVEDWNEKVGDE